MKSKYLVILGQMDLDDKMVNLPFENPLISEVLLLCDYSASDIAIGYRFSSIQDPDDKLLFSGEIVLKGVTQEFMKSFDEIPNGWKTICKFQFIGKDPPSIILSLPKKKSWLDSKPLLIFR